MCSYFINYISLGVTLSSDFIVGFCEETEEDHKESLSLLRTVQYDMAYLFAYSMRKVILIYLSYHHIHTPIHLLICRFINLHFVHVHV